MDLSKGVDVPDFDIDAAEDELQAVQAEGLTEFDLAQLVALMRDPVRSIDTCIAKAQLRKLCKQLLAQNLILQRQRQKAEVQLAQMQYREKH